MSEQPSGPPGEQIPFGLLWGIKRSFTAYVRRMPDGQGSIHDGAVALAEDTILFPADPLPADPLPADPLPADPLPADPLPAVDGASRAGAPAGGAEERTFGFHGDVRYRGHGGMLFVRVAAPVITLRGDQAVLSILDPYDRPDADRVALVTLTLTPGPAPAGARVWLGSDVRLTEAGVGLFNDVYAAGEPFEQLTVFLPVTD